MARKGRDTHHSRPRPHPATGTPPATPTDAKPERAAPRYLRARMHRNVLFDPDRGRKRKRAAAVHVPEPPARDRREDRDDRERRPHEAAEPRAHDRDERRERHRRDRDDRDDRFRTAGPLRKIVERYYYFDDDDDRDRDDHGNGDGHGRGDGDGDGHGGGGTGPGQGGRPTRPAGSSNGRLGTGQPLGTGDLTGPNPPGVWVGPRADMEDPYLFMRANPADLGARPVVGAPFWESPDIFILAGVAPDLAPDIPPQLGQIGLAGQPNTIYAHVWNFGRGAAKDVFVDFFWVNPSLGIDAESVQRIGQASTWLGAKGSGDSHKVVKCPTAWTPTFVNGGHECLIVRVWDNPDDLPGKPDFDASWNRHIAQRNIHVVQPGAAAMKKFVAGPIKPMLAAMAEPLVLQVGKLYGVNAAVSVARAAPSSMPWLQLHSGKRGVFPTLAPPTGAVTLSPPGDSGGAIPSGIGGTTQSVGGDGQQLAFSSSDQSPDAGAAHVYRISASQNGRVFGGYTVVVLG